MDKKEVQENIRKVQEHAQEINRPEERVDAKEVVESFKKKHPDVS